MMDGWMVGWLVGKEEEEGGRREQGRNDERNEQTRNNERKIDGLANETGEGKTLNKKPSCDHQEDETKMKPYSPLMTESQHVEYCIALTVKQ